MIGRCQNAPLSSSEESEDTGNMDDRSMARPVRFWWIERGEDPCSLPTFPAWCHKLIVLRDDDSCARVVASDARLDQHMDIAGALAAWRIRAEPRPGQGPDGGISGGGWGGERFPGLSQAFGPPPEDVVRAVRGDLPDPPVGAIPPWVQEVVVQTGCRSVEELAEGVDVYLAEWLGYAKELWDDAHDDG